jgi:hypothetical protein
MPSADAASASGNLVGNAPKHTLCNFSGWKIVSGCWLSGKTDRKNQQIGCLDDGVGSLDRVELGCADDRGGWAARPGVGIKSS